MIIISSKQSVWWKLDFLLNPCLSVSQKTLEEDGARGGVVISFITLLRVYDILSTCLVRAHLSISVGFVENIFSALHYFNYWYPLYALLMAPIFKHLLMGSAYIACYTFYYIH